MRIRIHNTAFINTKYWTLWYVFFIFLYGLAFQPACVGRFFCYSSCTMCVEYKTEFCYSNPARQQSHETGFRYGTVPIYLMAENVLRILSGGMGLFWCVIFHFIIVVSKSSIIMQLFSARWLWQQDLRDRARAYSSLSTGKAAAPSSPQSIISYIAKVVLVHNWKWSLSPGFRLRIRMDLH